MSQQYTFLSLSSKLPGLKQQLSSLLDKALKLSELQARQKAVDLITSLKKEIQQLNLKLEKENGLEQGVKVYNKIVLKINTLTGEMNMKKSIANKENKRRNKEEYEDLLGELVERDDKIEKLKGEIVGLRNQNKMMQEERKEMESNMKVILHNHSQSFHQDFSQQRFLLTDKINSLHQQIQSNLLIISQLKNLQKQNLLVCSKGAQQIHRLSQIISSHQSTISQQQQTLIKYQTKLIKVQQKYLSQIQSFEDFSNQLNSKNLLIQDQEFKIKVNQDELDTLKQILNKRNEQFKNVQQHYEGRIQEMINSHEKIVQRLQKQKQQMKQNHKIEVLKITQQLNHISSISQLKQQQILLLKKQLIQNQTKYTSNLTTIQSQNNVLQQRLDTLNQKHKQQQLTNRNLQTKQNTLQTELRCSFSKYDNKSGQIDELHRKLLKYHIDIERLNQENRQRVEEKKQVLERNKEIQQEKRKMKLELSTMEIRIVEIGGELERKQAETECLRKRLIKQQAVSLEVKQRKRRLEQEIQSLTTTIQHLNVNQNKKHQKYRQLQILNQQLRKQNSLLSQKLQQSLLTLQQRQADNRIQYQQQVKHSQLIKSLHSQISSLQQLNHQNQYQINSLHQRLIQYQSFQNSHLIYNNSKSLAYTHQQDKQNHINKLFDIGDSKISTNSKLNKSIKIKVLEDIKMILNKME